MKYLFILVLLTGCITDLDEFEKPFQFKFTFYTLHYDWIPNSIIEKQSNKIFLQNIK